MALTQDRGIPRGVLSFLILDLLGFSSLFAILGFLLLVVFGVPVLLLVFLGTLLLPFVIFGRGGGSPILLAGMAKIESGNAPR
jgi:hypothetical protein